MAPVASKFDTLPFSCYDVAHPWDHNCGSAALGLGRSAFNEGFKIYASCYVVRLLLTLSSINSQTKIKVVVFL